MAAASFDGAGGALGVHAASRKIGKSAAHQQQRKPVIIYMVSPKIIHVEAHEFMSLVQRLTGPGAAAAGDGGKKAASSSPREARRGAPPYFLHGICRASRSIDSDLLLQLEN
uniref:VQ domain-containing protein n=1 Tax=Oryza glumipatula TaxID=40148 RepID=A0A0E0ABK6_9ORYZ